MKINREELLDDLNMVKAGLSPREFIEQSSCLSADTVIHTLGGDFSISALLSKGRREFLVYSTDGKRLKIGKASGLRKTRTNARVFQVILDTGHSIKLTADHLVMLRDGSYVPVDGLKQGDSVMPFNHRFDGEYCRIYAGIDSGRVRTHVWVYGEVFNQRVKRPNHIHHKDENVFNNVPGNLEVLSQEEHARHHCLKHPPMHRPGAAAKMSKVMKGNKNGIGPKPGVSLAMKGNKHALGGRGGGGTSEGLKKAWIKRRESLQSHLANHRVVSVEYAGREDVYDLSVEKYHNFAANGIFVHNCFVFQDGMVMTFNDEVACRKEVALDITGAVQATSLMSILEKMDDPELLVRENEKGELEFKGKRKGFGITKDAEVFLPIDRVEMPEKWRPLAKEFTEAVGLVQHCVSTDESRFLLTCIHIAPGWIESCDNLQIFRAEVNTGLKNSVLVRGTSLAHIASLAMDEVALTKSWIHFRNEQGLIFSCRRYTEDYPALDKLIDFKGHNIVIPKGLAEASDRAAIFAADKAGDPLVTVSIADGVIRIRGEGLSGWYKEVKKVSYDGPPIEFLIAPELLKHISEKYSDAQLNKNKLKVVGGGWEYVTVLGAPEDKPEEKEQESDE